MKLAQAIFAMFGASILVWALLPLAEGDPTTRVLLTRGVENPRLIEI
ncbi:MAG TPA: hypothetical protein VNI84_06710 [Pyrinomonadaceae bacterium]|nr:hypothetical protein [Pyrinomonadaceae bacterium]